MALYAGLVQPEERPARRAPAGHRNTPAERSHQCRYPRGKSCAECFWRRTVSMPRPITSLPSRSTPVGPGGSPRVPRPCGRPGTVLPRVTHIMFGDISAWFYKYLAGIRPDPELPGFKRVLIRPYLAERSGVGFAPSTSALTVQSVPPGSAMAIIFSWRSPCLPTPPAGCICPGCAPVQSGLTAQRWKLRACSSLRSAPAEW